jgi:hypothetical protein
MAKLGEWVAKFRRMGGYRSGGWVTKNRKMGG